MSQPARRLGGLLTATLLAACVVSLLSFGVRATFGLFTEPLTRELQVSREVYALAIAIQNLAWGLAQPLAGVVADRRGARPVMIGGALLYAAGIAVLALATTPLTICLGAGLLAGLGMGGATTHFPAYLADRGMPAQVAAWSVGLVGLFNVAGAYLAGVWGGHASKKRLLAGVYAARGLVILLFIATPISTASVLLFGAAMGLLWLSTVPLTSGLVATFFGTRYMATLFGFVFLSHQVGSFLGVYLGGHAFARTGSYEPVWWACIALSFAAAAINLPIREQRSQPFARLVPA